VKNFKTYEKYRDDYPFKIELDSSANQLIDVPIYVKKTPSGFQVKATAKNAASYNFYTNRSTGIVPVVAIDQPASLEKSFSNKNISFKIVPDERYRFDYEKEYFFIIHDLASLTEMYRDKLDIKPISRESNIVEINSRGRVPMMDILFLNKLLDVYLENELHKRNALGIKTIQFIDDQ